MFQPWWNEWDDEEPEAPTKESSKVKSIDQIGMEREGNIITIIGGGVIWVSITETRWCTWKVSILSDLVLSGGL
jgi:hypothetical protein